MQDLANVLRSKEGAKILIPTQTKVEDACQLCRQVLKQSDWNNGVGVTYMRIWVQ